MNYTYKTTAELTKLLEKVCWYTDARKTGAPDAILISLADEMATATATYVGELWKQIPDTEEGGNYEERVLHKGEQIADKGQ